MLTIGHRGAAGLAPENTLDALRAGMKAGADILEFDVRITKDNVPIIIHDATTLRTHGKRLNVARHTLKELQDMHLTPEIPTLAQALDEFFGRIFLNIELKSRGSGKIVMNLLEHTYIKNRADWQNLMISSFKGRELVQCRRQNEIVPLALLHDQNPFMFIAYERRLHFSAVGFHRLYLNPLALEIAKRLGIFRYAYTVDRPYGTLALERSGIDGVVTNRPDLIIETLSNK